MKKRIVAILLSFTMCLATVAEAGAADFGSQASGEAMAVFEDSFTDSSEAEPSQSDTVQTDSAQETPAVAQEAEKETPDTVGEPEAPVPEVTQDPEEATQIPEDVTPVPEKVTPVPEEVTPVPEEIPAEPEIPEEDVFVSEAEEPVVETQEQQEETKNSQAAKAADDFTVTPGNWVDNSGKWKLRKNSYIQSMLSVQNVLPPEEKLSAQEPESADGEAAEAPDMELLDAPEAEMPAQVPVPAEEADSTEAPAPEADVFYEETENTVEPETRAAGEGSAEFFTAADGLVTIKTVLDGKVLTEGTYLFDNEGFMVTGHTKMTAGIKGYTYNTTEYVYFMENGNATLLKDYVGEIAPWNSDFGQMKKDYWCWTGKLFRYYDGNGLYQTVSELKALYTKQKKYTGYYKINGEYYYLKSDGTPYTGDVKIDEGKVPGQYYFLKAEKAGEIPGKMFRNGWMHLKTKKGDRYRYYSKSAGTPGRREYGYVVAIAPGKSVMGDSKMYLFNASGYLIKKKQTKAKNGKIYYSNNYGRVYREKLVKIGKYRYYFTANGSRATWKNKWKRCKGAGNRYYYFGNTAGRVAEKNGWQRIGKKWYYFNKKGNHITNSLLEVGRYFYPDGSMASGIETVNGKTYFFKPSTSTTPYGKMYKKTWIRSGNSWYYASSNGQLYKNGWKKINGSWYCFEKYKVLTNRFKKKKGVNGYLDSTGKYSTGWVLVSNERNQVKFINPDGNGFLKNASREIDGKIYYFNKKGYRINDVSAYVKGPYRYVDLNRKAGLMTVYKDSTKKIPIKSIRVSVGLAGTPTPTGTYTLKQSGFTWIPLMGPSWGQYGTHVENAGQGGIFVHSVACSFRNPYNIPAAQYNRLGSPASHGCIRCCVADAKWVYYNCNGATINIYDSDNYNSNEAFRGPLGRPALVPLTGNFDPTDDFKNPW